ncbi:MAG TPA: RNA 2',3'-cyclic phosphodiesterase [Thermodesulfobacteriota bacterium]
MAASQRLFAAVALPPALREQAARWAAALAADPATGRGVRWSRPEGLHLTLHFFGNVPEGELARVAGALEAGVAAAPGAFDLALEGLGAFPTAARPRVIWIGAVGEGRARLERLQAALAAEIAGAGFPVESRPFHAHVTLGRVAGAPPRGLRAAIEAGAGRRLGEFRVEAVTLYRSELSRDGSRYTELERWGL